ncbi:23S rRNA (guanosine(2251)-2'-O)-methyltransferase RlmB [Haloplasma contractile]|uniref:TrmH family tRNA-rRNA methyltransferase YacO protein n=1 Tax=Haloplasma contractile SSD-17B TaxID=1033810 RepID=U2FHV2_9MOLU|nr:23S rRNA (guanosine(2251)-2'-O)-methyltransferase RlmB [Haloplasma contractile]ERJ12405.1 Putative TrmH family tRNA-rRNA methyltransferase YacO protein [Haloplasma contractile SSD-17B]
MADYIYGKNTIQEAIKAKHRVHEVYLNKRNKEKEASFTKELKQNGISFKFVDKVELDQLVKGNHQGIIAKVEPYNYYSIDEILNDAVKKDEDPFLLILDGLEDPHNLGAIMRTADACGVHGIIIPKNRSVSLNATVAKLSSGAIEYVKVTKVTNITRTIKELKKKGIWIAGTDLDTSVTYKNSDYKLPLALVIGNEGKGISRLVKDNCDFLVKLPMKGKISSLNASVAAGILMYEIYSQRSL